MLKPPHLNEILSRSPVTVSPDCLLQDAVALMAAENVTAIVVTEADRPIGILTERDMLRILGSGMPAVMETVGYTMTCPPIVAPLDSGFFEAYHLCASRKIRHLILVDDEGALAGLASESDFLRVLGIDVLSTTHSIERDMIHHPLLAAPDMPLIEAVRLMNPQNGGVAIAALKGKPLGILTERDAVRLAGKSIDGVTLADVMSSPVLTIPLQASVYYAIDQMRIHRVRHMVVVNQDGDIAGLFTEHDVVKRIENRYIEFLSAVIERQIDDLNAARDKLNDSAVLTSILRESLDMALVATDVEGVVRYMNPDAAGLLGANAEVDRYNLLELAKKLGLAERHVVEAMEAAKRGERYNAELIRKFGDGEQMLRIRFAPIMDESSSMLGYVQTLQDITERRRAMEALQKSASIFDNTLDGIIVTDADCNIVAVNPAFIKITGYSEDEVLGKNPSMLSSGRQDGNFYQRMWQHVRQDGYWQGEIWNRRKNGDAYAEWLTINAIKDEDNSIVKYIGVFADITALKSSQEKYEFLAHHDPLTALPNRLLCHARLEQALRYAKRHNDNVAVMMLDIDNFKPVNDTWGHQIGDKLLQEIGNRMVAALRSDDTAARLGGDEFVVVLESVKHPEDAAAIAEKLLKVLSEAYRFDPIQVEVSVSIGIAMSPKDGEDVETLLKRADLALYEVKAQGRNAYRFYQSESHQPV